MKINYLLCAALMGTSVALVQPQALALSSQEVNKIATQITVQIESEKSPGTGIIVKQDGNTYTVLTCNHVVAQAGKYTIITPDGARYPLDNKSVKKLKSGLDLATVSFNSNKNYTTAKLGNSNNAIGGSRVYIYGFPAITSAVDRRLERWSNGEISANASQPLPDGYALLYTNRTVEGMSGSPVLNENGEVIGVHGRSETDNDQNDPTKTVETGFNLGIPINSYLSASSSVNVPRPTTPRPATTPTVDYFLSQGWYKLDRGDNTGAIADFNSALRIDRNLAIAYTNRGAARFQMGDNQGVIADYNSALRLDPNDAIAYNNRGIARSELGDKQGEIADFNSALRINPNYAKAYYNRGVVRSKLGDNQGAIADYNSALRIDPNFAFAYNNRGLARFELGDNTGAITDYNSALHLDPNDGGAYRNRGIARFRLGDNTGAIADYNSALRIDPNFANAYGLRGFARYVLRDKQGALADLQQAANLARQQKNQKLYQLAVDSIKNLGL